MWKYCSIDPPSIISSTKNIVKVDYNTRIKALALDRFEGFRLEWIVDGCGGTLEKRYGEFTSPGYPGYYPANISCEWIISTLPEYTINLVIQDFSFETTGDCMFDSLAVRLFIHLNHRL